MNVVHMTYSPRGVMSFEMDCPCPKAACGMVILDQTSPACLVHHPVRLAGAAPGSSHWSNECPEADAPPRRVVGRQTPAEAQCRSDRCTDPASPEYSGFCGLWCRENYFSSIGGGDVRKVRWQHHMTNSELRELIAHLPHP